MQTVAVNKVEKHYINCPACGSQDEHRVDHLFESSLKNGGPLKFYRWHCKSCSQGISGSVEIKNGKPEVLVELIDDFYVPVLILLQYTREEDKFFVVIRAKDFRGEKRTPFENADYFYDEHTCPINWTGQIIEMFYAGRSDPHGVFQFVRGVDVDPEVDYGEYSNENKWTELFPEIVSKE